MLPHRLMCRNYFYEFEIISKIREFITNFKTVGHEFSICDFSLLTVVRYLELRVGRCFVVILGLKVLY